MKGVDHMYEYKNGDYTYTYVKPLEKMTKKELFHFLKLNRNEMKRDIEKGEYVNFFIYQRTAYEGYMLMREIEKRNKARGKGFVKSDGRHIGAWYMMKDKYEKYMEKCIGFQR